MNYLTGLVGQGLDIRMRESTTLVEVKTKGGGTLTPFIIDLKIVAIACAVFFAACLFSAPISYLLVAGGAVALYTSYKKDDGSAVENNSGRNNAAPAASTPAASSATSTPAKAQAKDPNAFMSDYLENKAQKFSDKVNGAWSKLFGSAGDKKASRAK